MDLSAKQDKIVGASGQIVGIDDNGLAAPVDLSTVGVVSFNGRQGFVVPTDGDYTAEMVGARPDTWMPSATDVGADPVGTGVAAAAAVKDELLNGAGGAYDTLKELGDLIDINVDAIKALETVAAGKQNKITGTSGQIVGFDASGNAVAQNAPVDKDTTYSAGTGLSLSGTTFSLPNSGVTAGSYGPTANVNGANGNTINVPQITVDAQGRVTSVTNRTYTSVNTDTNTTYSAATTSAAGLMSAEDKTKLNGIATGANAYSLPTATSSVLGGVKVGSNITVSSGTISLTKANVTAALGYTPPTSDTNTDTKVTNTLSTSTKYYVTGTSSSSTNTGTQYFDTGVYVDTTAGKFVATSVYGAVWNDYAEYRAQAEEIEPGYCVISNDQGQISKTTEKYQACDGIVSDTFGFAIGETDECKTPLAVAGRVLAYCEGDRYDYHAGDTVCAGPDGKVCKMTREEVREWPDRIVGIVSEIPEYEVWGSGNVSVNGRIWIKIK